MSKKRWDADLICYRRELVDGDYLKHTGEKDDGNKDGHYFASSIYQWITDNDLYKVMRHMEKGKAPYNVFWVPLDEEEPYEIEYYQPQVDGIVHIFTKQH
tara:strand:+ start:342 stop:641 length:300 start_codon:yes stop_codon:yes gene_type:complete